jgi:hypothetical protein
VSAKTGCRTTMTRAEGMVVGAAIWFRVAGLEFVLDLAGKSIHG